TALASGATLVLAAAERGGDALARLIREHDVSHATLPPVLLAGLPEDMPLQTLIVAGEACPADEGARWSSGRPVVNAYGPTGGAEGLRDHEGSVVRRLCPAAWSSDLEHAGLCIGWLFGACVCWGCWGALHRGGWGWAGVCWAWRADGGALCCGSVWCCGEPDV